MPRHKSMTLDKGLVKYLKQVSILKKGYEAERYRIQHLCRDLMAQKDVREITSVDIADYRDRRLASINIKTLKPLSTATVRLEMSLLSNFFEIARIEWGISEVNPVINVRKPKPSPGRDRLLSAREERLILRYAFNHSNHELYSIIVIAIESAMRQGEILKIKWEDINLKSRIVSLHDTKNGTKRDVPLSFKARDAFIRIGVKPKGKVFNYTSQGIKSTWRFMLQKLSIEDLHFHDLRHHAITALFRLGTLDIMEISAISGHKSLAMLKRYTHLKAIDLVRKLHGNKNKGKQTVLDNLIPYPALLQEEGGTYQVRLLDFDEMIVTGISADMAIEAAQNKLRWHILNSMQYSSLIPSPDQYLDIIPERDIIMIDPMAMPTA